MTTLILAFLRGSLIVTLRAAFALPRPTLISTDLMPDASLAATTSVTFLPRLSAPLSLTVAFGLSMSTVPPTGPPPPPDGEPPPPVGEPAPGSPPAEVGDRRAVAREDRELPGRAVERDRGGTRGGRTRAEEEVGARPSVAPADRDRRAAHSGLHVRRQRQLGRRRSPPRSRTSGRS